MSISYNINDICRVCLVPTTTRRNSNLFFSAGRSVQLWAKIMACAWVQVFEGDGLPSQICYKCHNKLDIAYQFKQQCESADAQIRQYLSRNKGSSNNIDLSQNQPECLAECKPLNFNIASDCLDLAQNDFSLSAYRLMTQDASLSQQVDFRIRESDVASMKQEPGLIANLNLFNPFPLTKSDCQQAPSFKCESLNDNDIMLDAKLLETFAETIQQSSAGSVDQLECKIWDLHQRDPDIPVANKNDCAIASCKNIEQSKEKDILNNVNESEDLSFLDDERCVSPIVKDYNTSCAVEERNNAMASKSMQQLEVLTQSDSDSVKEVFKPSVNIEHEEEQHESAEIEDVKKAAPLKKSKINKDIRKIRQRNHKKRLKVTDEKENTKAQCELCGKVFKYRTYMIKHLRIHSGDKPFPCTFCDQRFSMQHILQAHLRTHSGDRPYVCAVCGKAFRQSSGLKTHSRTHTGEKPFECEMCHRKFSMKSNLIIHKQSHSSQREHVCHICDSAFKLYKHLQSHIKIHSQEKEFKCTFCPKSFRRKNLLETHLSIHRGERPYKCSECSHSFTDSSNLRAHQRIHLGIKPYKCKVCKKAFVQSSGLNRHMQQHTLVPVS